MAKRKVTIKAPTTADRNRARAGRDDIQMPLSFVATGEWTPPNIGQLPAWPTHGRVGVDIETRDPLLRKLGPGVRRGGYIVGYSFAIEGGPSYYVPLRHGSGDNVIDPAAALRYLADQGTAFKGEIVGANLGYDLDFLAHAGVLFPGATCRDVQIADCLINEMHESYALGAIAQRRGVGNKDEGALREAATDWDVDPKQDLWKLPARYVAAYAVADAELPLRIYEQQRKDIDEEDIWKVFDLESNLLPVVLRMRRRGVKIDQDALQRIEDWTIVECRKEMETVYAKTGYRITMDDLMKPGVLAPVLESLGIVLDVTSMGKPSVDKDVLESFDHPATRAIARGRRLYKLKNTFVASIRTYMTQGRIHASFHQVRGAGAFDAQKSEEELGARWGRLSSSDPNIQQQPARDPEFAKMWRSIYIPEDGRLWASNDYSKQEPRVLTHYAELCACKKAKEFADLLRSDPKACPYKELAKVTKTEYKETKVIYLGLSYAMGGGKLCHAIGKPTEWKVGRDGKMREMAGPEGQAIFNQFHAAAPFIRDLGYKIQDVIQARGFLRTLLGRKIRFPLKDVPTINPVTRKEERYDWAHKGINRLVQGSSADQTKQSLIDADAGGHYIQLQVHDEIGGSVENAQEAERMADYMRKAVPLTVPVVVDVEVGPSWGGSMG